VNFLFCRRAAVRLACALLPLVLAGPAGAEATAPDAPETVRVTGVRAIPWKSYRAMRAAMDAYEQHQALAPDAVFRFGVLLPPGQALPPNFALRVRTQDGKEYPVQMDKLLFQLPILPDNVLDADLVTNLKGVPIRIGIKVETPGVPEGMDRLGDLRLNCQIDRAIDRADEGVLDRLFGTPKCDSKRGGYWLYAPLGLPSVAASLVEGTRSEVLLRSQDARGKIYQLPLQDASWGNDALIEYRYTRPYPAGRDHTLRFTFKE
jgi:hypothetical protein